MGNISTPSRVSGVMCSSLELAQALPRTTLPSHKISLAQRSDRLVCAAPRGHIGIFDSYNGSEKCWHLWSLLPPQSVLMPRSLLMCVSCPAAGNTATIMAFGSSTGHQHGLSIAHFATEGHRDALWSMLLPEAILMSVVHVVATDHVGGLCCHQGP